MRPLWLRSFSLFLALGACSKKEPEQQATSASAVPAVASAAVPVASAVAPDADAASDAGSALAAVAPRKVPAGNAPNATWTVEFNLERVAGDENLDWPGAVALCQSKGKQLCLETQWQRACELDPELGKLESWTLTADYPGSAVRGGADGCKTRVFKKVSDKSETRAGLCCDRAVAISSEDKSDEFRTAATKRVLEVEAGLTDVTPTGSASKLLFDQVSLEGDEFTRELALLKLSDERKTDPTRVQFYDHCTVKMSEDPAPMLLADCGVVQLNMGKTRGFPQRIAFESLTGPVVYLGDPKAMKPKERKERVRAFLPSE
ncbi:MAG TPA: hypothetical protein VM686_26450 [Polyangiaceae bacterium]|nr:hypothetical protein [Polyangiaceae bacterium]